MASREEMNEAAQEATDELDATLLSLEPGQELLATDLVDWVRKWYLKTGYRRLMRHVLREAFPPDTQS